MRYRALSSLATGMLAVTLAGCSVTHRGQGHLSMPAVSGSPASRAPIPAPATVTTTASRCPRGAAAGARDLPRRGPGGLRAAAASARACFHSAADYNTQIRLWHQPGTLHEIATVLLTHGAATDGYTYPGFALSGWHTQVDYEDSAALHVVAPPSPTSDASSYTGPRVVISFAPATGSKPNWCGISPGG